MTKELLDYFKGDELAASVWLGKYALEGEKTPDDMHRRMAKEFARIEFDRRALDEDKSKRNKLSLYGRHRDFLTEEKIFEYFKDFKYILPQGSVMSQLGAKSIGSLSNCFVIGQPEDSYGSILQKEEQMIQLMKRRGGVGLDISTLRPENTPTTNAARSSTGAVSFMHRFSNGTREVAQNGRRGALMISININHPDVLDFIKIKRDLTKVTGANISLALTNDFMRAVEADEDYYLKFPVDADISGFPMWSREASMEYNVLEAHEFSDRGKNPQTVYIKRVRAKEIWDEIITSAHGYAEPGLFFIDNHYNYSPDGVYPQYKGITTNPCGEIFMQPHDACRLIAVNFFSFVRDRYTPKAYFDRDKFYEVIYEAMRLSDDLIDLEIEAIDRIIAKIKSDPESDSVKRTELELWIKTRETAESSRRTGLGFTALGDMVAALGYKYDSPESMAFVDEVMKLKLEAELDCTIDMAVTRGKFEGCNVAREFKWTETGDVKGGNDFYQMLLEEYPEQVKRMINYGRRNVSFSTVAPTGSLSILAQKSSGMEPVFMLWYMRRKKVNQGEAGAQVDFVDQNGDSWSEHPVLHEEFKNWANSQGDGKNVESLDAEGMKYVAEHSPWFGSTAPDINWVERVQMQGVIQKYTTHSISSTINLPSTVTEGQVSEIYVESWKKGLKGVTVYRDGSRSGVLVSNTEKKEEITKFDDHHAPARGKYLDAKLVRFNNNKEKWIAFVGLMDNKPYEIFTGKLDEIKIPGKIEEGRIVKVKLEDGRNVYHFEYEGGSVDNIGQVFHHDFWNYSKLVSGILRHGMPLPYAVDLVSNLNFPEDHINTWKNGVARTLKKFIVEGEVDGIKCSDCGGRVQMEEGCLRCIDCGSSKCG